MKQFLAIILLIAGAAIASGQTPETETQGKAVCTLTMAQSPQIRGLRLGMTEQQLLALFPGSREDKTILAELSRAPTRFGAASILIRPDNYASKADFAGMGSMDIRFLDGRVSGFRVSYNKPEWKTVDEFIAKVSEQLSLPTGDTWEPFVGLDNQLKILKCSGFEINAFMGLKGSNVNYLEMRDTVAVETLKERKAKAREKALESNP